MAFLWVHSRLGGWRESAGALDYCGYVGGYAAYIHSAPRASGGGTISKADTFSGLRPETECTVHEGAIASSRPKGWYPRIKLAPSWPSAESCQSVVPPYSLRTPALPQLGT